MKKRATFILSFIIIFSISIIIFGSPTAFNNKIEKSEDSHLNYI